jgi:hypothetical protein
MERTPGHREIKVLLTSGLRDFLPAHRLGAEQLQRVQHHDRRPPAARVCSNSGLRCCQRACSISAPHYGWRPGLAGDYGSARRRRRHRDGAALGSIINTPFWCES